MRQYRHRRSENPSAEWPNPLEPGELAVNTSNRQLAVGDAAFGLSLGAPVELLAVRFFDVRAIYVMGDVVLQTGDLYRAKEPIEPGPFDPAQWTKMLPTGGGGEPGTGDFVLRAGDTMTGFLTLHALPVEDMHAVPKIYIDTAMEEALGISGRRTGMVPSTQVGMPHAGTGIDEAPEDGIIYGRHDTDWVPVPIQADAPKDGKSYLRKDNLWAVFDIDDIGGGDPGVPSVGPYVRKIGDTMTGDLRMEVGGTLVWSAGGAAVCSTSGAGNLGHRLQVCDSGVSLFEWNGYWQGGSFVMNAAGALLCVWGAKPGGGSWATTSDARVKNVHGPYNRTLDDVVQLNPILYNYIGNDTRTAEITPTDAKRGGAPYRESQTRAVSDVTFAGLIAQEVELVFPEMVTQREGYVDGELVTDMRDLDTSPLIFAMVNAIKELKARIEVLEAAA